MEDIIPKHRKLNYAFYFNLNDTKTKVCKTFFKNTLDNRQMY